MPASKQITLRIQGVAPTYIAKRTRQAVDAGGRVTWVWTRDRDFRKCVAALGAWPDLPHWGTMRIGEGQSIAFFAATGDPAISLTYFVRRAS